MEIDEKKLQDLLFWLIDLLYKARQDLVAYQVAHSLLAAAGLDEELGPILEKARQNPPPALLADHQAAREKVASLLTLGKVDEALEFLRQWKPTGPVH